jgi:hypothetical protein
VESAQAALDAARDELEDFELSLEILELLTDDACGDTFSGPRCHALARMLIDQLRQHQSEKAKLAQARSDLSAALHGLVRCISPHKGRSINIWYSE